MGGGNLGDRSVDDGHRRSPRPHEGQRHGGEHTDNPVAVNGATRRCRRRRHRWPWCAMPWPRRRLHGAAATPNPCATPTLNRPAPAGGAVHSVPRRRRRRPANRPRPSARKERAVEKLFQRRPVSVPTVSPMARRRPPLGAGRSPAPPPPGPAAVLRCSAAEMVARHNKRHRSAGSHPDSAAIVVADPLATPLDNPHGTARD